jgi:hypothetical protein
MRPVGLIEVKGSPTAQDVAAIVAAVLAVLDDERRKAGDSAPLAYGSRWRRAAIREGIEAGAGP